MTMVKTLVALATERMLLKTSGPTFLRGIEFMYAAGLAPDRLSVMMTSSHKYVLQFHSKCDIRPFAANYPNFGRVLRGIVHVREWRIKSIEFVNVAFYMRDVDNLERAIEKLGVELVLLRNCTYPGVQRGDEAVKFLSALNRKKQAVVCEYGDDRLKHRIGRRTSGNRARRASRNGQEVIAPPPDQAEIAAPPAAPAPVAVAVPVPAAPPAAAQQQLPREAMIRPLEPIMERNAGLNNEGPLIVFQAPVPLRRPIPMNPEQARQAVPQPFQQPQQVPNQNNQPQAAAAAAPAPPAPQLLNGLPGRAPSGRVVVGAHVYEFRAVDVPNADNYPAVQNLLQLNHLLNVINENHDLRVIVLPEHRERSVQLQQNQQQNHQQNQQVPNNNNNNNNNVMFGAARNNYQQQLNNELHARAAAAVAAVGGALPGQDPQQLLMPIQQQQHQQAYYVQHQPIPQQPIQQQQQQMQYDQQQQQQQQAVPMRYQAYYYPQQQQQQQVQPIQQQHQQQQHQQIQHQNLQPQWNNGHNLQQHPQQVHMMNNIVPQPMYAPYPMFGVDGNEPMVQQPAVEESNDSVDHQEMMYDPDQQRHEALRDLVADPEAQPNFAPVEAQGIDLEDMEEEEAGEEGDAFR